MFTCILFEYEGREISLSLLCRFGMPNTTVRVLLEKEILMETSFLLHLVWTWESALPATIETYWIVTTNLTSDLDAHASLWILNYV